MADLENLAVLDRHRLADRVPGIDRDDLAVE